MSRLEQTCAAPAEMVLMCSLRTGRGLFGIETTKIREVLGATSAQPVPLAPGYIDGVVPYRGEVLTAVSFRALLGLEKSLSSGCILVLDDEQDEQPFGLVVDAVGGVVGVARNYLEPNPSTLDARSMALFGGTYRTDAGLMVHLEPQLLRPSRLAECNLFGSAKQESKGERI
jgi:purine-binding chemotaxis protein CheW